MNTDERIDYAESEARAANLSGEQVAGMQAFLLGVVLTHFDETPIIPLTDSRWRRAVREAIAHKAKREAGR